MDAELKERLVGYLDTLESAVKSGGDFAAEHAPETVRQLVHYEIVLHSFWISVGFVLISLTVVLVGAGIMKLRKDSNSNLGFALCVFALIPAFPGTVLMGENIGPLMKVWLAPNVFILERIAEIVK